MDRGELSLSRLGLIYTGLRIVYVPLLHVTLMMPSGWGRGLEDRRRRQNESRDMHERWQVTVTRNNLHVSTRAINFARWPVNGIGGGQHGIVSTALLTFAISPVQTFQVLGVRHMMRMRIPSTTLYVYCYPEKGIKLTLNFELWTGILCICHTFRALYAYLCPISAYHY